MDKSFDARLFRGFSEVLGACDIDLDKCFVGTVLHGDHRREVDDGVCVVDQALQAFFVEHVAFDPFGELCEDVGGVRVHCHIARIPGWELVTCEQPQFMACVLQEGHEHRPDKSRGAGDGYFHRAVVWVVDDPGCAGLGLGCML